MAGTTPRPTGSGSTQADASRAGLVSRLLVLLLASLFVLGAAGFAVAAISARPRATPSAVPGASSVRDLAVRVDTADRADRGGSGGGGGGVASALDPAAAAPSPPASAVEGSPSPDAVVDPSASPASSPSLDPGASPSASLPADPSPRASAQPSAASPPADPSAAATRETPIVPVAGFWSKRSGISRRDLVVALETGGARGYDRVVVPDDLRAPLEQALGIRIARAVRGGDVAAVERAVARGALGFLAASDVTARVRALDVDGVSLFGNDRVRGIGAWPLSAPMVPGDRQPWSQRRTWTLVAGGDSFTDRGVYERVVRRRKGIDYPFDGGRARITGSVCCGAPYDRYPVPTYELSGPRGVVRRLVRDADLAIANHEQPVTDAWSFHLAGTRFSGKPELTEIFRRAGIDWLSLANNHIKDYSSDGIADTRRILARHGIRFGGAGETLRQARRISYLDANGTRVAIVPCLDVAPSAMAGRSTSGATPCRGDHMRDDLREASRQADVVIAMPHWGVEYSRQPTSRQRALAARWVRHGADLVLGAHSHVAGAIEEIDGRPVLYSMGNFIFDQGWSSPTMQSFLVEATFHGDRLAQLRLHPFLSHDQAQPNLMDPGRDGGRKLLLAVRRASADLLDW